MAIAPAKAPTDQFPDLACEEVACFICGEAGTETLHEGRGFAMGRCRKCGLVRQNPRLTAAALAAHYAIAHRPRPVRSSGPDLAPGQTQHQGTYEASVDVLLQAWPADREKGLWIDVGAAAGALLLAAREQGWQPSGVELGAGQARHCSEKLGIDCFQGILEEAGFPDACAGVVSFRHVLEHLHQPLVSLAEARRILRPDGMLLIEVPNYSGLKYSMGRVRRVFGIGKDYWLSANIPEHLYYFTPRTLEAALDKAGFRVTHSETYGKHRPNRSPLRKAYDGLRDGTRVGNKLRVIAVPA